MTEKKGRRRRRFDTEKRAKILAEYDEAEHGKKNNVLRKYRVNLSHLHYWRKMRGKRDQ